MDIIPLLCPRCALVFESPFGVRGTILTLVGKAKIVCPRCFYPVEMPEATYTGTDDGRITITDYAPQEREIVEILQRLMRSLQGDGDEESVIRELEHSNPSLGALARTAKNRGGLLLLMCIILFLVRNCSVSATIDINAFITQAYDIINAQPLPGTQPSPDAQNPSVDQESHIQAQDNNDREPRQSRQQRRRQERQSKKPQPSSEQSKPSKGGSRPKGKRGPRK